MDLEIEGLTCRRGGRLVFRDLRFALSPGQAAAVTGPNGVGKSTLLRVIAGLIPPAGGEVRLGDRRLTADAQGFQERVLYAGHQDAVKPQLGVAENLGIWAGIHGTPRDRVLPALERFGIGHIAGRAAVECSAGQKRRLGLARLLVIDRPLWLLDEPTVSLDVATIRLLAELVGEHLSHGGMALIATHQDLGLGALPELRMTPPAVAERAEADPFLDGGW